MKIELTLCAATFALALASCAPKANLLDSPIVSKLEQGIASGESTFDHTGFDALLTQHVDATAGRVDYAGLQRDRGKLDAYTGALGEAKLEQLPAREQQALLINAYNAYTLTLILDHYPTIASIRDVENPWKTAKYKVGGFTVSLDDIEHGLLRPLYRDERVHFAVNCASVGCPPLQPRAFTGEALDAQLTDAAKATLGSDRYLAVRGDKLAVTKILEWYGSDFTDPSYRGHKASIPAYVSQYAAPEVKRFIDDRGGAPKVTFMDYDWSLNDKK